MNLQNLLIEKRSVILDKWLDLILEGYQKRGQTFFKKEKDRFLNPVGYEFRKGIGGIYRALIEKVEDSEVTIFIDKIARIRAVQDFSPAQAVSFIFLLKKVIKEELGETILKDGLANEWLELESKIDNLALLCFNIYMQCKEKLYEIRVNEIKRKTYSLLKRADLIYEIPDFKEDNSDSKNIEMRRGVNEF